MNLKRRSSFAFAILTAVPAVLFAQPAVNAPLQAGVGVQMAVTSNAVAVPRADTQDALVVALTADGTTYLGVNRLAPSALAATIKRLIATRNEKTVYIKADARVPYARLVEVLDAVQNSGVDGLTFLTTQPDTGSRPLPSKGLQMRVVNSRP